MVAKVEMFRRGANYTAMWLPKMEWIVSIADACIGLLVEWIVIFVFDWWWC